MRMRSCGRFLRHTVYSW